MKSIQNLKCITDVPAIDLIGKRVLLRYDLNLPIVDGKVVNDYRIRATLNTLEFLSEAGAKVIVISHTSDVTQSLRPMAEYLNKFIANKFIPGTIDRGFEKDHKNGEVVVLENLRFNPGEKSNDPVFAEDLARLGDIFVNEAFAVSHRSHASVVGLPKLLPSYVGPLFKKEVENLSKAFNPEHPFLLIIGGAKFSTKIPLAEKFIELADEIFIGGATAHPLLKARGFNIGQSLMEEGLSLDNLLKSKNTSLPIDVTVNNKEDETKIKKMTEVKDEDSIQDAGPETLIQLAKKIKEAKIIIWNGPIGNFEDGYDAGTKELAEAIAKAKAYTIIGGGDTLEAIEDLHIEDKINFISTAGGAMLDFLSNETLPGIEAIIESE